MSNSTFSVITLDGPAGAGKGTVASLVANKLGWRLLDSGILYRLTALAAMRQGVPLDDEASLADLAEHMPVDFTPSGRVMIPGTDEEQSQIRAEQVGKNAALVAKLPQVRQALLLKQRGCAAAPGLVAEGRDMGTVVFPGARFKFFLTANVEERAQRRYLQLRNSDAAVSLGRVLADLVERDEQDSSRSLAPLRQASDAVLLDSTGRSADQVVEQLMGFLRDQGLE
ncbi:MAG: (d)CMP kinase [Kistimonas sp.]|nr:(d)CMP kinase [Kistimonas sp.]